jgi:hypothetical protein
MGIVDEPTPNRASPRGVLTGSGIKATRSGNDVALSFLVSEGQLSRLLDVAIPFDEAVRLSAQLRRAIEQSARS